MMASPTDTSAPTVLKRMLNDYCSSTQGQLNLTQLRNMLTELHQDERAKETAKVTLFPLFNKTLHTAAQRDHRGVITQLCWSLDQSQSFALLVQDHLTPLHEAALNGHEHCVEGILTRFPPEQQLMLLNKKSNGDTASDLAKNKGREDTIVKLKDFRQSAEQHLKGFFTIIVLCPTNDLINI